MRSRYGAVAVSSCLLLVMSGCASNPLGSEGPEWEERKRAELSRAAERSEMICVPGSKAVNYLLLFYTPWDRRDYQPVLLPQLKPDVLARIADGVERFKEGTEAHRALAEEVNDIVNDRLPEINSGKINAIYVSVGAGLHLGIAPAVPDRLHVWVPKGRPGARTERKTKEELWVFDTAGAVLDHMDGKKAKTLASSTPYMASFTANLDRPGYWTFAAWPARITGSQIDRCKEETDDVARH